MPARPNLTVIRCADIESAAMFYRIVGLEFEKHRHGTEPENFAASDGTWVFELYPASAGFPSGRSTRVGFSVDSCDEVVGLLRIAGFSIEKEASDSPWGRRAVAVDPDGHRVELTSPSSR